MATDRRDDLAAFRDFVDRQLANGGADLTPDECLDLWDIENQSDREREETLAALRRGLEDVDAGRTRPAEDVLRDLCRKYDLPEPQ